MNTEDIKRRLKVTKTKEKLSLLSTGSTLLNLACSGKTIGGFAAGHYFFLVGDSTSGKTFLALTCLAEAAKNKNFNNHRFILDNAEGGALMSIEKFFGKEVAKRLEIPEPSETIEDFYYSADDNLQKGPCIIILDSMDALGSKASEDKFSEQKTAHRKGKEVSGSYGDAKAKMNSQNLRRLLPLLKKTGSILIIISQTRDNLGFGAMLQPKTRSGGRALRFYATLELWSSIKGKIKQTIQGKPRQLGIHCQIEVKKNRFTGRERKVIIPIYHSFGIDDIGSCIDYLIEEKYWKTNRGKIDALELGVELNREDLVHYVEEKGLEKDLRRVVSDAWEAIEKSCQIQRKKRYQ